MRFFLFGVFAILCLGIMFQPMQVVAQGPTYTEELQEQLEATAGKDGGNLGEATDPRVIIALLVRTSLGLVGTVFFAYTIYAGFMIMTAAGDEGKIEIGKKTMVRGIMGIVIILTSYAITTFVINILVEDDINRDQSEYMDAERDLYDEVDREQRQYRDNTDPLNERTYYLP
ncbi:pilin [Patescibacteria group bacterium]|nr:pilin [Patescibacteria group bacterium]MBU1721246.1 pilin [Patescibacteria group bacterium]MBU1901046.1 pilin [Patescibacteria group bacterium]